MNDMLQELSNSDMLFFGFLVLAILIIVFWCYQSDKVQNVGHVITVNQNDILQRLDRIERRME